MRSIRFLKRRERTTGNRAVATRFNRAAPCKVDGLSGFFICDENSNTNVFVSFQTEDECCKSLWFSLHFSEFVFDGEERRHFSLQNSGVSISTPAGAQGSISCAVHTDPTLFLDHIPDDECLIAPIVDCQLSDGTRTDSGWFTLSIPCCQNVDPNSVRVRHGNIYTEVPEPFEEIMTESEYVEAFAKRFLHEKEDRKKELKSSMYAVRTDSNHIIIFTKEFSQFICTSCKQVCHGQGQAFVFGKILQNIGNGSVASLRLYTCSPLYLIEDYREVRGKQVNF